MLPGFNGNKEILAVAANQAVLSVLATGPTRRVKIEESALTADGNANTKRGLQYRLPNDGTDAGFTQWFPLASTDPALYLPDQNAASFHDAHGVTIGNGPGVSLGTGTTAATTLLQVRSATADATAIIVTQDY